MSGTLTISLFSGSVAATTKTITWASEGGVVPTYPPKRCLCRAAVYFTANGVPAVDSAGGTFYAEVETSASLRIALVSPSGNLAATQITGVY